MHSKVGGGGILSDLGEEKNRSKWKKFKVVGHMKGRDGVARGVKLLHKGHTVERLIQAVCLFESKSCIA